MICRNMAERLAILHDSEALLGEQTKALETFFGHEALPEPPKALMEFIERTTEQGFTFEPYFEPRVIFTRDSNYPGLVVKPSPWFFEEIRSGNISSDAASLSGQWTAMEAMQKPDYDGGQQLYENDLLASILERLRKDGKIAVPDWCQHIPAVSRFGVSWDEIAKYIVPQFADLAHIDSRQVGLPSYIAFNFRGNAFHPEWGETNTWEWFADSFRGAYRLFGGCSDYGGLANVHYRWSADRHDDLGFRSRVDFSS